ncbi:hypothetical protein [Sphingobacterium sp. DR205]|uniref:hypothetical protein n=1 Tax=Sphingobacterium sp. DR205 TaxID=2713573 RepID=UPI0013E4D7E8|nr:hypothetical protein [Sphingobacterium sp. DR205]QIH33874.1 hypothetical protein G6053_13715 [Sphingobacterium sp. DR205]
MLRKKYIDLHKGQWLKDLFAQIPSDKLIDKGLTGIGATTMELLNAFRNAIIVVPNVPAILGKVKAHKGVVDIMAVKNRVRKETIINYLTNDEIKVKKLMTTPESFHVIVDVMELLDIDMYKDYFLLIDECDKMIVDSHYRKSISDPMWHFFSFENKAIISATAIEPSDPRFVKHNFEHIIINPKFDFSVDVELIATNNPVQAFKKKYNEIKALKDDAPIFVFFDSVRGILTAIEKLKLKSGYSIFCSSTSRGKIKKGTSHLEHIFTEMDFNKLNKINFLTSRFYTAIDIEVKKSPHIIILSDVLRFPHTMVNPSTDVVQIKGRFRNIDLKTLTCISNHTNRNFYRTECEVNEYLKFNKYAYNVIKDRKDISIFETDQDVITEVLQTLPYDKFMRTEDIENHYMIDNFRYKNKLTAIYAYVNNWVEAFKKENMLHHYFNPKVVTFHSDEKNGYLSRFKKKFNDIVKDVVKAIEKAESSTITIFKEEIEAELQREYPDIIQAYELLGKDKLIKIGTSKSKISREILLHRQTKGFYSNFDLHKEAELSLELNTFYSEGHLKSVAEYLISKYDLKFSTVQYKKFLQKLFVMSRRTERRLNGKSVKGHLLLEKLF